MTYDLVHTSSFIHPALPSEENAGKRLRHVLLSWKQQEEPTPEKIIYLLERKYKKGIALEGIDALRLAIVDGAAKDLGFRLGLARVVHSISGPTPDDYDDYTSDAVLDVKEVGTEIDKLATLEGELICDELEFEPVSSPRL